MNSRRWTMMVALLVDCDLRTAARIVDEGPQAIRSAALRERAVTVVRRRKEIERAFLALAA